VDLARIPTDGRIVTVQQALRQGATVEELYAATGIDPWFLDQVSLINEVAERFRPLQNSPRTSCATAKITGSRTSKLPSYAGAQKQKSVPQRHELKYAARVQDR
jgi:carbamoyl-phosphate synthase large subunit